MQIAFWSTVHGQTATTSSALAIATMTAINNNYKTLIAHTHIQNSTLEKCFLSHRELNKDGIFDFSDNGIDALCRLAKHGRLTPDIISNYTVSLLQNSRLDLLAGTIKEDKELFEKEESTLRKIFACSNSYYDLIFVDVHSGLNSNFSNLILDSSDLIVVCLNQNRFVIEDYIREIQNKEVFKDKKILINLGMYDNDSKNRVNNILRKYKFKNIITVPYNTQFKDECNNSTVLDFLIRNIRTKKDTPNYTFIKELQKSVETLLKELEVGVEE
jgi:MinD-like ATPase involved in chromosome partitioning or flagellar assembly